MALPELSEQGTPIRDSQELQGSDFQDLGRLLGSVEPTGTAVNKALSIPPNNTENLSGASDKNDPGIDLESLVSVTLTEATLRSRLKEQMRTIFETRTNRLRKLLPASKDSNGDVDRTIERGPYQGIKLSVQAIRSGVPSGRRVQIEKRAPIKDLQATRLVQLEIDEGMVVWMARGSVMLRFNLNDGSPSLVTDDTNLPISLSFIEALIEFKGALEEIDTEIKLAEIAQIQNVTPATQAAAEVKAEVLAA